MEFHVISDAFNSGVMPIITDTMWVIVKVSIAQGIYYVVRTDRKAGIDKIKYAISGYIMLKFIDIFLALVDQVVKNVII